MGSDFFPCTQNHGFLLERLRGLGIAPTAIDFVIYSHADLDHVCGGVNAAGKPAFANARYVLLDAEWHFWSAKPERLRPNDAYDEELRRLCREMPVARLGQLADRLDPVTSDTEIVPGVRLLAASGHTPGHACIAFSSGNEQMLFIGDLFYNPAEIADPDWFAIYDYDPAQAIATRRRVFTEAARDRTLLMGYHLPFPGLGYITEEGRGWTWTASLTDRLAN